MKEKLPKGAHKVAPTYSDIKKIIKPEQLAAIGALALAFNELEGTIDRLFFTTTELSDQLQFEISTRMGGSTDRLVIVKIVAEQLLSSTEMEFFNNCLTDNDRGFETLSDCRNGIIHVRNLSSTTNVGITPNKRGDVFGRLVRLDLLDAAYDLILAVNKQLQFTHFLIEAVRKLNTCKDDDPEKSQREEAVRAYRQSFLDSHTARLALPKLPKFPSESELLAAKNQHDLEFLTAISHAMIQWDVPPHLRKRGFSDSLWTMVGSPGFSLPLVTAEEEAKKKK